MTISFNSTLRFTAALITIIALLVINGCNNEDSVQPGTSSDNVDFSSVSAPAPGAGALTIEIDQAKLLLRDIKLNVASGSENMVNFKTGPYVLNLDFNSGITFIAAGYIPAGTYDKVKFEIHKLNDNEETPDPEFIDASGRYSTVIKGRVNGTAFTFKSSASAHQMLSFPNLLKVNEGGKSNITLQADAYQWFLVNGIFVDPLNEANRNVIELNIKNNINNNIKIFVDNDRNGQPD